MAKAGRVLRSLIRICICTPEFRCWMVDGRCLMIDG